MATTGMYYRITGADKHTGKNVELVVEATDEKDALRQASERGVFVLSCAPQRHPVTDAKPGMERAGIPEATAAHAGRRKWGMVLWIVLAMATLGCVVYWLPMGQSGIARYLGLEETRFWTEHQPNQFIYDLMLQTMP